MGYDKIIRDFIMLIFNGDLLFIMFRSYIIFFKADSLIIFKLNEKILFNDSILKTPNK
jgi:hypothetical protein